MEPIIHPTTLRRIPPGAPPKRSSEGRIPRPRRAASLWRFAARTYPIASAGASSAARTYRRCSACPPRCPGARRLRPWRFRGWWGREDARRRQGGVRLGRGGSASRARTVGRRDSFDGGGVGVRDWRIRGGSLPRLAPCDIVGVAASPVRLRRRRDDPHRVVAPARRRRRRRRRRGRVSVRVPLRVGRADRCEVHRRGSGRVRRAGARRRKGDGRFIAGRQRAGDGVVPPRRRSRRFVLPGGFLARGAEGAGMPSGGAASGGATYESVAGVAGIRSSANADRTSVSSVVRCAFATLASRARGSTAAETTRIRPGMDPRASAAGSRPCVRHAPRLTSAGFVPVRIFVDGSDANALGDSAIFSTPSRRTRGCGRSSRVPRGAPRWCPWRVRTSRAPGTPSAAPRGDRAGPKTRARRVASSPASSFPRAWFRRR